MFTLTEQLFAQGGARQRRAPWDTSEASKRRHVGGLKAASRRRPQSGVTSEASKRRHVGGLRAASRRRPQSGVTSHQRKERKDYKGRWGAEAHSVDYTKVEDEKEEVIPLPRLNQQLRLLSDIRSDCAPSESTTPQKEITELSCLRKYRDERNRERRKSQEEEGRIKCGRRGTACQKNRWVSGANGPPVVSGVLQAH
ncbi:hypothetical protein EYF80_019540 [Liparis tanakae]|uniref:Uncharacterized protein n=1 Tax=Liparis tanakae TaxID=230148 RepID=A0A4Z2HWU5_9TELE|nr:hypothetical protein EYF80_019540 [Liparis tanakae]